jgi:hypothetical protein
MVKRKNTSLQKSYEIKQKAKIKRRNKGEMEENSKAWKTQMR